MRGSSKSPTPSTSTTFSDETRRVSQSSSDLDASPVDFGPLPRDALRLSAPPTEQLPGVATAAPLVALQAGGLLARRRASGLKLAGVFAAPGFGAVPLLEMGRVRAATHGAAEAGGPDLSGLYDVCDGYLCSGSTGTVRRAWRRSDRSAVALKDVRCPPGEEEVREVTKREYEFMTTLSHPSIVRALAIHESVANVVVCMEYCDGGSLEDYVKSHGTLAPAVATSGALQVLQALDYMHSHRVAHRDVKPANIVLNAGATEFKLVDFNSAKQIGNHDTLSSIMLTNRGTECYSAPEIHAGLLWNERVDLWAAGLSIYFMRCGRLPFDLEKARVRNALLRGEAPRMDLSELGDLMSSLVRQCLEPNPSDRPPAVELLAHPAFRGGPARAPRAAAFVVDVVPACGLVWRLPGADAVKTTEGSGEDVSACKVFSSPQAECDQSPLWRRLAERRFSRGIISLSDGASTAMGESVSPTRLRHNALVSGAGHPHPVKSMAQSPLLAGLYAVPKGQRSEHVTSAPCGPPGHFNRTQTGPPVLSSSGSLSDAASTVPNWTQFVGQPAPKSSCSIGQLSDASTCVPTSPQRRSRSDASKQLSSSGGGNGKQLPFRSRREQMLANLLVPRAS